MNLRAPHLVSYHALWLATIASKLAPTVDIGSAYRF
jgi:hypothetical protein